jgi:hypothetical protein
MSGVKHCDGIAAGVAGLDASRMSQVHARSAWEQEMGDVATAPIKYERASALLLGWEPDSCDTGVAGEVGALGVLAADEILLNLRKLANLRELLQNTYNFSVQTSLMNTAKPPQQQAFQHLANFVVAHDKPRTLLIIYYAGHGYSSARGMGRIALSGKPIYGQEGKLAGSIEWHEVERTLSATSSDVLVIFDCCQAGELCRSAQEGFLNSNRIFQYLGACESGQVTSRAGKLSFTSAIIWALEQLAGEASFPITKLVQKIEAHEHFPRQQKPVLFGGRFDPVSENICLAPMRAAPTTDGSGILATTSKVASTRGVMELSFHFPRDVTETDIIQTAGVLKECMRSKKLNCDKISFIDQYSLDTAEVVKRWKDLMQSARQGPTMNINLMRAPRDGHGVMDRILRRLRLLVGKGTTEVELAPGRELVTPTYRRPLFPRVTVRIMTSMFLLEVIRSCIGISICILIVRVCAGL